jgi:hypothetical protein
LQRRLGICIREAKSFAVHGGCKRDDFGAGPGKLRGGKSGGADGIYVKARIGKEKAAVLVIMESPLFNSSIAGISGLPDIGPLPNSGN